MNGEASNVVIDSFTLRNRLRTHTTIACIHYTHPCTFGGMVEGGLLVAVDHDDALLGVADGARRGRGRVPRFAHAKSPCALGVPHHHLGYTVQR